ncbi:MAG: hypothetical protein IPM25_19840 [Chloracidobacterium sp.]|nr:hypothetical protein [Chloracidobacterium sp.]
MSKLTAEEIKKIVQDHRPGSTVSGLVGDERPGRALDSANLVETEASTPSISELRRKYLGDDAGGGGSGLGNIADMRDSQGGSDEVADDEIVSVVPEASSRSWDAGSRPRAAVISGSEKKIVGEQG